MKGTDCESLIADKQAQIHRQQPFGVNFTTRQVSKCEEGRPDVRLLSVICMTDHKHQQAVDSLSQTRSSLWKRAVQFTFSSQVVRRGRDRSAVMLKGHSTDLDKHSFYWISFERLLNSDRMFNNSQHQHFHFFVPLNVKRLYFYSCTRMTETLYSVCSLRISVSEAESILN